MTAKTNAARILDAAGVSYEIREYAVDESDLSAPHVAEAIHAIRPLSTESSSASA